MMNQMNTVLPKMQKPAVIEACCPSCGRLGNFRYGGEQRLPARVAQITGMPMSISLWHCDHCHSTLSEVDLKH